MSDTCVTLHDGGIFLVDGVPSSEAPVSAEEARRQTIAYGILSAHNTSGDDSKLKIKFDAMVSHDITYVGIIQTARASGLTEFPLPYAMTNCPRPRSARSPRCAPGRSA